MKNKLILMVFVSCGQIINSMESDPFSGETLRRIEDIAQSKWQKEKESREKFWTQLYNKHDDIKDYYERLERYEEELFLGLVTLEEIQIYLENYNLNSPNSIELEDSISKLKTEHQKLSEKIEKIKDSLINNYEKSFKNDEVLEARREKLISKCTNLLKTIDPILRAAEFDAKK